MTGLKGYSGTAAMALFVVGSFVLFPPGAEAQGRSAEETATHGRAVSRELPFGIGRSTTADPGMAKPSGMKAGRQQIMAAQRVLNDNGAGLQVDGILGPRTRQALMNYQAQHGLPVSGRLDSDTLARMGL